MSAYGVVGDHGMYPNYWLDDEGFLRADDSQLTHAEFVALQKSFRDFLNLDSFEVFDIMIDPIYCPVNSLAEIDTKKLYSRPGRFISVDGPISG